MVASTSWGGHETRVDGKDVLCSTSRDEAVRPASQCIGATAASEELNHITRTWEDEFRQRNACYPWRHVIIYCAIQRDVATHSAFPRSPTSPVGWEVALTQCLISAFRQQFLT